MQQMQLHSRRAHLATTGRRPTTGVAAKEWRCASCMGPGAVYWARAKRFAAASSTRIAQDGERKGWRARKLSHA